MKGVGAGVGGAVGIGGGGAHTTGIKATGLAWGPVAENGDSFPPTPSFSLVPALLRSSPPSGHSDVPPRPSFPLSSSYPQRAAAPSSSFLSDLQQFIHVEAGIFGVRLVPRKSMPESACLKGYGVRFRIQWRQVG